MLGLLVYSLRLLFIEIIHYEQAKLKFDHIIRGLPKRKAFPKIAHEEI
jgi:hypothetical protein